MENKLIRDKIRSLVASVKPYDLIESDHIENISNWISSNNNIFRIKKDALPPKHLVSYSVVIDQYKSKILLFDHKKAMLMLPSGGHININELPLDAAKRELKEELGLSLEIYSINKQRNDAPFFVTVTQTVGISEPHTDVSLWYLFSGDSAKSLKEVGDEYSKEFSNYHWLNFDKILATPVSQFDPHMHRFVKKIKSFTKGEKLSVNKLSGSQMDQSN